jgi:hypothetical protein
MNKLKTINMKALFFFACLIYSLTTFTQTLPEQKQEPIIAQGIIVGADTFAYFSLPWLIVEQQMPFATKRKYEQWTRLKHNVKKVYPYAIMAAARLKEYERELKSIPDEDMRKKYMAAAEKQLQKEFGEELKKLSINQGKILIKLIDRETGNTSYDLVKQLRGNFSAFMWQSLARLFGSNLKSEYDPNGEDRLIELAIKQIEASVF